MKELTTNLYASFAYETPAIEIIEVQVEQGFATSGLNFGRDGSAGDDLNEDDIIYGGDY